MADSIAWRRFCLVPLDQAAPHPTTLMKITSRCGERAVAGLNDALLAKAAENKVIKTDKVRADTVVEADVCYPTDSGLLAKGVAKLARLSAQLKAAGLATRTTARDRTRWVHWRAHAIGAWLRRRSDDAKEEAKAITGEMATIATCAHRRCPPRGHQRSPRPAPHGDVGLGTGRCAGKRTGAHRRAGRGGRGPDSVRLGGGEPDGSTRVVSLHDADARPIAKGRLGKPWSSATRPRSSTTSTVSCSTTPCSWATRPMR